MHLSLCGGAIPVSLYSVVLAVQIMLLRHCNIGRVSGLLGRLGEAVIIYGIAM